MFLPLTLLISFVYIGKGRGEIDEWERKYVIEWEEKTKRRMKWMYIITQSIGTVVSIVIVVVVNLVVEKTRREDSIVMKNYIIWPALLFLSPSLFFLLWLRFISFFRSRWLSDSSREHVNSRTILLDIINYIQIACLFLITSTFVPVARVILTQFQCNCSVDTETKEEKCSSNTDSSVDCFPSLITLMQGAAIGFAILYLIGIPILYYKLVSRTVALVISTSRAYKLSKERLQILKQKIKQAGEMGKKEQKEKTVGGQASGPTTPSITPSQLTRYKSEIHSLINNIKLIYYQVVSSPSTRLPSTSLFAAYQESYKFAKLTQMFQKLFLLIIISFIPSPFLVSSIALSSIVIWLIICRPYNDKIDDILDISAQGCNLFHVVILTILNYNMGGGKLSYRVGSILLLSSNIIMLCCFGVVLLILPIRMWWKRRKTERMLEEQEKRIEELQLREENQHQKQQQPKEEEEKEEEGEGGGEREKTKERKKDEDEMEREEEEEREKNMMRLSRKEEEIEGSHSGKYEREHGIGIYKGGEGQGTTRTNSADVSRECSEVEAAELQVMIRSKHQIHVNDERDNDELAEISIHIVPNIPDPLDLIKTNSASTNSNSNSNSRTSNNSNSSSSNPSDNSNDTEPNTAVSTATTLTRAELVAGSCISDSQVFHSYQSNTRIVTHTQQERKPNHPTTTTTASRHQFNRRSSTASESNEILNENGIGNANRGKRNSNECEQVSPHSFAFDNLAEEREEEEEMTNVPNFKYPTN